MEKNSKELKTYAATFVAFLLVGTLFLSGCVNDIPDDTKPSYYFYSFEKDMQGWVPDGTDLFDPPINWSIERSDDRSSVGNYSVKLHLDNMNDAGKIWMERSFELDPNTQYEITIDYDFATRDYGSFNLFRIITGASLTNPETYEDLTFQDDTGHHQDEDIGYTWVNKSYTVTVQTSDDGIVYVFIGIWGTWTTSRTYYVDSVNISFEQSSTENLPDISGLWTISYYDFMGNLTNTEQATLIQNETSIKMQTSNETLFEGVLLKNNLAFPYNTSEFIITNCDFRGLGIDYIFVYNETTMETNMPLCENCRPASFTKEQYS